MDSLTSIGAPTQKVDGWRRIVFELAIHAECTKTVYGEARIGHVVATNDARPEGELGKNEASGNETRTRRPHADDGVTTRGQRVIECQAAVSPRERA
jgi:hypothetical protein